VHISPTCAESGEGSDHFESYERNLSLHFCKRLFPGHEPMTSWSQGNNFTAAIGLPFITNGPNREFTGNSYLDKKMEVQNTG
jgi:hypothetical protein